MKYDSGLQVVTYEKYGIRDGQMANNPLLHEMPDPITKATWDNYIMVAPSYAKNNGIKSGDVLKLETSDHSITLPAVVQPGVAQNVIGVAVGYGRKVSGKVGTGLGANAFPYSGKTFLAKFPKLAPLEVLLFLKLTRAWKEETSSEKPLKMNLIRTIRPAISQK